MSLSVSRMAAGARRNDKSRRGPNRSMVNPGGAEPDERSAMIGVVQRMGAEMGRQPTQKEIRFRVPHEECRRVFGDYCALLRAAGYRGQLRSKRITSERREEMLNDFGRVAGRMGRFPTTGEYQKHGLFTYRTFKKVFRSWKVVRNEFVAHTGGVEALPGTLRALTEKHGQMTYVCHPDRPVCGKLLNYRAMLHEPTNEQGVVLLFGMMAEELGFIIENVRTSYPDCEGKRRVGVNSWQRVRIEFEFLSSRFKHPVDGCDLVVCWRDDVPPKGLEVMSLEKVLREKREKERHLALGTRH